MAPKPYVIAEIASAHEGDEALAARLIDAVAATGVDAVKLQVFRRDSLIAIGHPKFASFGEIELPGDSWRRLIERSAATGLDVIIEVFDEASLKLCEACGVVAAYKFPTSDIANMSFLRAVIATGRPLYIGVGGAKPDEVRRAVAEAQVARGGGITLVHGFQAYPTRIADANLARIEDLRREFNLPVCYADHTDATENEFARLLPALALAYGATSIEKHVTDDRSRKGRDHYAAFEPAELRGFVQYLARAVEALGHGGGELSAAELEYRRQMKRSAVATYALPAGARLTAKDVTYKRTYTDGLAPDEAALLIGHRLRAAKSADEPIARMDLE